MVLPLIFASWTYIHDYIDVPKRMDAFETRAKRDSLYYVEIIKDNRMVDSIQSVFLQQDYEAIEKLKNK